MRGRKFRRNNLQRRQFIGNDFRGEVIETTPKRVSYKPKVHLGTIFDSDAVKNHEGKLR